MSTIDPRIPLQSFAVQPNDPMEMYARFAQLRALGQDSDLRRMQIQEAQMRMDDIQRQRNEAEQIRQAARGAIRPGAVTSYNTGEMNVGGMTLPGRQSSVQGPAQFDRGAFAAGVNDINPLAGVEFQNQFAAQDAAQQKAAFEQRKQVEEFLATRSEQERKVFGDFMDTMGRAAGAVKMADPRMQPQVYAGVIGTLRNHPNPLVRQTAAQAPEQWTPELVPVVDQWFNEALPMAELAKKVYPEKKAPQTVDLGSGPQGPGKYAWNDKTGAYDNYLGKLPKQVPAAVVVRPSAPGAQSDDPKAIAQAIIDGNQPPTLQGLYRYGAPVRAELARKGYNLAAAQNDWNSIQKHIATMNGQQQERLRQAVNFAYDSLDQIEGLYQQWKKLGGASGVKMFNKATLAASKQMPGEMGAVASNLEALINDFTSEMGTVYKGGNSSTDETLRLASGNLKAEWNEQTFNMALKQLRTSLGIRRNSYMTSQPIGVREGSPYLQPQGGGNNNADPMGIR